MDFSVGTSRFRDIVDHFWYEDSLPGQCLPGAKVPKLIEEALSILSITGYGKRRDSIVYVGGGLPDITTMIRGPGYQEVVCLEAPLEAANRVMRLIEDGAALIYQAGAVPVFTTCTPMNLTNWNYSRLSQGKTSHLNYHQDYLTMQTNHEESIKILNSYIDRLNFHYHMQTPRLANYVFQKRGEGLGFRFRQNRLSEDGCHPTPATVDEWIKIMREAMDTNRIRFQSHYSDFVDLEDVADESAESSSHSYISSNTSNTSISSNISDDSLRLQAAVAKEYSQAIDDLGRSLEYKNIEKRTKTELAYMREHGIKFVEY